MKTTSSYPSLLGFGQKKAEPQPATRRIRGFGAGSQDLVSLLPNLCTVCPVMVRGASRHGIQCINEAISNSRRPEKSSSLLEEEIKQPLVILAGMPNLPQQIIPQPRLPDRVHHGEVGAAQNPNPAVLNAVAGSASRIAGASPATPTTTSDMIDVGVLSVVFVAAPNPCRIQCRCCYGPCRVGHRRRLR